ncbi:hypothetical protein QAD02_021023 [Eretmocerus hayati]|uniref:Uncharacterized protein n=1 Tax=Eretmocerus hayati TaxID=131215 RepID=A0ACC2PTW4_9HYME|nr:hypothetical protein QAD02_021023 [Eretmocerus hayati]
MLNTSVESSRSTHSVGGNSLLPVTPPNTSSLLSESPYSFQEPHVAPALQVSTTSTSVNSAVTCAKPTQRARYELLTSPSSNPNRTLVAYAVDVDEELSELFEDDFSYAPSPNGSAVTSHVVKPKVISNVLVTSSPGSGDSQGGVSHELPMIHTPNSVQSQHSFDVHGDESLMAETSTPEPPSDASVGVWKNLSEVFGYAPPSY